MALTWQMLFVRAEFLFPYICPVRIRQGQLETRFGQWNAFTSWGFYRPLLTFTCLIRLACGIHVLYCLLCDSARSTNAMVQKWHTFSSEAVSSGWRFWLPYCETCLSFLLMREPEPNIKDSPPAFAVLSVNRLLTCGSDVIIVNGESHVAILQERYRVPASPISYVPLGPRTTAARWSTRTLPEEPGTILFFGECSTVEGA